MGRMYRTERFGDVFVEEAAVIRLPTGLEERPDLKEFVALRGGPGNGSWLWLQSLQEEGWARPTVYPKVLFKSYHFEVDLGVIGTLGSTDARDFETIALATVSGHGVLVDLRRPIIYCTKTGLARQLYLPEFAEDLGMV